MEENSLKVPDGWKSIELGKLLIERKKSSIKVSDAADYGQYPFFTSGEAVLRYDQKLTDGKNLFLATGGLANIKYFDGEASYSTDTYTLTTNEIVETEYLYYYLLNIKDYINANYFLGSGLKHLQKNHFKKHLIYYPNDTTEQQTITDILSKIDEAIEETDKLISKYSRIKIGLMQDLLTKGIDEKGNIRSEETHEFKDSPLGRIPVEWNSVEIDEIKEFITSGSRGWAKYYSDQGSKFIRITNLKRNQIEVDIEDMKFVKLPKSTEGMRSKLIEGDLLISITADLGIIGVIPSNFNDTFINQHIALVRLDKDRVNPKLIGYFLASPSGQRMFSYFNDPGAKAGLNLKTVSQLLVPEFDIEEQNLIVEKLEKNNTLIIDLNKQLEKLKNLKTGLMQDFLSGKVRVNHIINETVMDEA